MATLTVSNRFKYEKGIGTINFSSDIFNVALMKDTFVFDESNHNVWADVSTDEIGDSGNYPIGGKSLTIESVWQQDNGNNRAFIEWNNITFSAVNSNMETFKSGIVYVNTHIDKVILGCIVLDNAVAVSDGNSFQLQDLGYDDN